MTAAKKRASRRGRTHHKVKGVDLEVCGEPRQRREDDEE
jgi:hypothetical protein